MREINTYTLIGDMIVGDVDVAYSTYLGYDEIAPHSGVRDNDAWYALRQMDKQIKHLTDANKYCPRDYHLSFNQTMAKQMVPHLPKDMGKHLRIL